MIYEYWQSSFFRATPGLAHTSMMKNVFFCGRRWGIGCRGWRGVGHGWEEIFVITKNLLVLEKKPYTSANNRRFLSFENNFARVPLRETHMVPQYDD